MQEKLYGFGLPFNASAHGAVIDQLIYTIHVFMFILFFGWLVFFIFSLWKFRARAGHKATYKIGHFKAPTYIEVGVALFEAFLLVAFAYPVLHQVREEFPPLEKSLQVHVIAEQYAWNIHYAGEDGKFGKRDINLVSPNNPIGLDKKDPDASDDVITINELNIPVHKPVIVTLSSKDVIHSFSVPVMRVKQDAIPGQQIKLWFEAAKEGKFEIACAQLCGLGHYRMRGFFNVEDATTFNDWLSKKSQKSKEKLEKAKLKSPSPLAGEGRDGGNQLSSPPPSSSPIKGEETALVSTTGQHP